MPFESSNLPGLQFVPEVWCRVPLGSVLGLAFGPSVSRSKTLILNFPVVLTLVCLRGFPPKKKKKKKTHKINNKKATLLWKVPLKSYNQWFPLPTKRDQISQGRALGQKCVCIFILQLEVHVYVCVCEVHVYSVCYRYTYTYT